MAEGSVITEKGRALLGKILATNSTCLLYTSDAADD